MFLSSSLFGSIGDEERLWRGSLAVRGGRPLAKSKRWRSYTPLGAGMQSIKGRKLLLILGVIEGGKVLECPSCSSSGGGL